MIPEDEEALTALLANGNRYVVCRYYDMRDVLLCIGTGGPEDLGLTDHAQQPWFTRVHRVVLEWHTSEADAASAADQAARAECPEH